MYLTFGFEAKQFLKFSGFSIRNLHQNSVLIHMYLHICIIHALNLSGLIFEFWSKRLGVSYCSCCLSCEEERQWDKPGMSEVMCFQENGTVCRAKKEDSAINLACLKLRSVLLDITACLVRFFVIFFPSFKQQFFRWKYHQGKMQISSVLQILSMTI